MSLISYKITKCQPVVFWDVNDKIAHKKEEWAIHFIGLYSGLTPTLLRDVPFSGIYFMFYSYLKAMTSASSSSYISFADGMIAGALTSLLTQPADVIKTNMQLYPHKYGRLKTVIPFIYHECGVIGFWRGVIPRALRRTLMSAISWTVYEEVMKAYDVKT